ncbi:MAG: F0F1 ATP synthase subunit C [Candidatus Hydrogenedentota bacterium]
MPKTIAVMVLVIMAAILAAPMALAAPEEGEAGVSDNNQMSVGAGLREMGVALSAALCILGGAFATAKVQAAIGAGGTGAMAEKPELFGRVFILVALPETMVVLGFVLGIVIALNI